MDRRNSASILTKRKAQPYLLLSPPRSERDVGFCFVALLTGTSFFVWFVCCCFLKKKFGKKAYTAAICKGCIPSGDAIHIPWGKQVK